jgi:hypothetical protein
MTVNSFNYLFLLWNIQHFGINSYFSVKKKDPHLTTWTKKTFSAFACTSTNTINNRYNTNYYTN